MTNEQERTKENLKVLCGNCGKIWKENKKGGCQTCGFKYKMKWWKE